MAKKQTAAKAAPKQEVEVPVVETPVVEALKPKKTEPKKPDWEIKDRVYYLTRHRTALSYSIKSSGLYFFDKEKGYEREIKYCENQRTPFVDEMQGDQRLSHIMFRNGALYVPKNKVMLQKFLSIYHPLADVLFYEYKPTKVAESQLDVLEMEADALILARSLDIDKMEAIMRVELGSKVSDMSSKELKRDCLVFAKRNPYLFLELLEDDNVELRNFGIKATEARIIELSTDQRTFSWVTNGRKLMTVPFDEHPYSALAAWFKTDEGMEIYSNIEKRLNM
jgi:hypothetical protein|tara:strand:+ start:366 stop:1205 length:840 start_codon:yes stop_codon:yes gene_type:complete